jgi:glycosyltransferase involved in cell wall biosynthesis
MLATGQQRDGYTVSIAAMVSDVERRADWSARVRAAGVPLELLVHARRDYLGEWRSIVDLLRSRRPSVVHTHGYHADVVGGLAARRVGLPLVSTVHGFIGGDWKNRLYERVQYRVFRHFDAVMPVSRPMVDQLRTRGVPADRLHVVPNAFAPEQAPLPREDARRELGIAPDTFAIGWVGRLSVEKGADVAVRALAEPRLADARLSFVGDGAERESLRELARELGVSDRVTWHGTRANAAPLLTAFDVLVISSRTEGTPIVLFETMAAGTPIVAARVGGVPDVVSETEASLVPPEDPAKLARAIDAVRNDVAGAMTRAAAARRRLARDFAIGAWVNRVGDVYAAALRQRSDRPRR